MAEQGGIATWMGEPAVRQRINERISGRAGVWPTDWLLQHVDHPVETAVSLGCGEGALERDLVGKGICRSVLGIDASHRSIALARERASAQGQTTIEYRTGDMNRPGLSPESFDAAFFHQSLHHVSDLGSCLDAVRDALREDGWLYLDEYVGPSRRSWNRALIAEARAVYETLPDELKRTRKVRYPIDRHDPTEAIRSGEILQAVEARFDIIERRDYGGNLLALIHPNLKLDALSDDERALFLEALLDIEDDLLERGAQSYYTIILARPKER